MVIYDSFLLDVLIYDYSDIMGLNHCQSSTSIHQQISFKLTIFWIAVLTLEADKIARLLACRHYKIDRDPQNSPLPELQKIKKAYLSMLLK